MDACEQEYETMKRGKRYSSEDNLLHEIEARATENFYVNAFICGLQLRKAEQYTQIVMDLNPEQEKHFIVLNS